MASSQFHTHLLYRTRYSHKCNFSQTLKKPFFVLSVLFNLAQVVFFNISTGNCPKLFCQSTVLKNFAVMVGAGWLVLRNIASVRRVLHKKMPMTPKNTFGMP